MNKKTNLIIIHFFICLLFYQSAQACKYTVRDIGFTDLGSGTYQLCIYVDDQIPAEKVTTIERIAFAAFLDANVEAEVIHIERQKDHPALKFFQAQKNISPPAAILVDPLGETLRLPFHNDQKNINESVWRLIEKVVSSPFRKEIIDLITDTYGTVLLIEGKNSDKNRQAKNAISDAIGNITHMMELMPKPIKGPPQLVVLSEESFSEEAVLLWSLGVSTKDTDAPQLAILYSRGRRIGPILKGVEITKDNIFSLLAIIGADCECGLDRTIMLGKMIPLRWEKQIQEKLIPILGFDVENPLIKTEMRQILSMSPTLQKGVNSKSPLSAYKEGIIKFNPAASAAPLVSADQFRDPASSESRSSGNFFLRIGAYSFGGILLIVIIIGSVIFVRARKRQ
jgi:hypothetical protein